MASKGNFEMGSSTADDFAAATVSTILENNEALFFQIYQENFPDLNK